MALLCGIDEAGRGPVIGPLVICGVLIDEKDEISLKDINVKDSKLLIPHQREEIYEILKNKVKYKLLIINPKEIDSALQSQEINLNWLEAIKSAEIINFLKPAKAILDCPSTNINAYTKYLKNLINDKGMEIICEHKADLNHLVVGAASILAKVTRDREIEKLKKSIGINFGSGYPSDPLTQDFLRKNYSKYPDIFRKEWASYKEAANISIKKQKSLSDY
jgi:ribonuclease HII